jgi:precorrin-2 dehydrogenase/sirohydrochlorin ferrochelatase
MAVYYPLFMNLKDQWVLVVGGGAVAYRKVKTLLACQALVRVVSPRLIAPLDRLIDDKRCFWSRKEYSLSDLGDVMLVFACTEKAEVNDRVASDAQTASRPVNVADNPEKGSFIVPSIFRQGDLSIAVSTGGASPLVARQIRKQMEETYGDSMAAYLDLLKTWRPEIKRQLPETKRQAFWEKVTDGVIWEMIKADRLEEAKGVIEQCFQSLLD